MRYLIPHGAAGLVLAGLALLGLAACENSPIDRGLDRLADQVVEAETPAGRSVRLAGLSAALCERELDSLTGRAHCASLNAGAVTLIEAAAGRSPVSFEAALDAAKARVAVVAVQAAARKYGIDPARVGLELVARLLSPGELEGLAGSWFRIAVLRGAVAAADAGGDPADLAAPYLARLDPG